MRSKKGKENETTTMLIGRNMAHYNSWFKRLSCTMDLLLTIGNGSVRFGSVQEGPNQTGLKPNRLQSLKPEPNQTKPLKNFKPLSH